MCHLHNLIDKRCYLITTENFCICYQEVLVKYPLKIHPPFVDLAINNEQKCRFEGISAPSQQNYTCLL